MRKENFIYLAIKFHCRKNIHYEIVLELEASELLELVVPRDKMQCCRASLHRFEQKTFVEIFYYIISASILP